MVFCNLAAVLVYSISSWWLMKKSSGDRMLLGYLLLLQGWSLVSCFYNDLGVYNFELFDHTETTLATTRLAAMYVIFNLCAISISLWLKRRPLQLTHYKSIAPTLQPLLRGVVLSVTILFLGFVAFQFATMGVPLLQGLHKLTHAQDSSLFEQLFLSHGFVLVFLLGWVRGVKGDSHGRDLTDFLFVGLLCYLIGAGHKFSQLIYLTVSYLIVPSARLALQPEVLSLIKRRLRYILPLSISALLLLSFGSYLFGTEDNEFARVILLDRVFGNQGHLWWGTDQLYWAERIFDPTHWQVELDAAIGALSGKTPEIGTTGMSYLMLNLLGPTKAYGIFDSGYLYTMAYPAIAVMSIGYWLTLLLQVVWGGVFMAGSVYLYRAAQQGMLIRALIMLQILLPLITASFSGSLVTIFTVGMLLKVLLLVTIELGLRLPRYSTSPRTVTA